MKALAAWIAGVFALGLLVGSFVAGISAEDAPESSTVESAVTQTSMVDCGVGRRALLEPVVDNGRTTTRVVCVSSAPERSATVAPAPAAHRVSAAEARSAEVATEKRSWKDSALIIGGGAGAGAGIGAIAKGGKGAAVGAAIGGAAATIYDLATRNKK